MITGPGLGAIHFSTVGHLVYLGDDPYGGAVGRVQETPHTARSRMSISGPTAGGLGLLASALHVAFYLKRNPEGHVVTTHRQLAPTVVAAAEGLLSAGCDREAAASVPFLDVLAHLLSTVQRSTHQCQ